MNKIILLLILCLNACHFVGSGASFNGHWKMHLNLKDNKKLPFILTIQGNKATLHNGSEKFELEIENIGENEIKIPLHVFDAGLELKFFYNKDKAKDKSQYILSGEWIKYYKKDYRVKVFGHPVDQPSINNYAIPASVNMVHKRWDVTFKDENGTKAIGNFEQVGSKVTGTFLTSTGDYRPMQGQLLGNVFELYGFDGGYANIAKGKVLNEKIKGEFWGGQTYYAEWEGIANADAKLPDPYAVTFLKDPNAKLNFELKDKDGNLVKLNDAKFDGKIKIVMISGTWCPNCMDEAKYMSRWADQNKGAPVEIFSLFFERAPNEKHAMKILQRYAEKLNLKYHLLLAGIDENTKPLTIFPELNQVLSYPTTIFIDKKNVVRKIHSGFTGPGTGEYYQKWQDEFNLFMKELMK